MTTCTRTDPTSILCMKFSYLWISEMISQKPIYSFLTQEMKTDQIQIPLHCMRDGVSNIYCKLSDMTFDKIRKIQANMVTPIKEAQKGLECLYFFLLRFRDSSPDIVM